MTMATTSPWLAVAAGMLTVGAPCVLPMLRTKKSWRDR